MSNELPLNANLDCVGWGISGLRKLGVDAVEVRKLEQLVGLSGLIIPGGESTTMAKLAEKNNLVSGNLSLPFVSVPLPPANSNRLTKIVDFFLVFIFIFKLYFFLCTK